MNTSKLAIAIALTGMVSTSAFATNGYFSHGYGAKEKGMAGAGVAKGGSSLTTANNPANLTQLNDRWDWGVSFFNPNRSYTVEGSGSVSVGTQFVGVPRQLPTDLPPNPALNQGFPHCTPGFTSTPGQADYLPCQVPFATTAGTVDSNRTLFAIPSFGYVNRLDEKMVFGFSLYGNGGMNSEYHGNSSTQLNPNTGAIDEFPGTLGGATTGVDLSQLFLNTSLGYQVSEAVSLGGSIIVAVQSFEATGLQSFANISTDASKLTNNGHDTAYGYGFKLGANFSMGENFTFGISYQTEMDMGEFDDYAGLFAEQGDFDIPATYTIGFSWNTSGVSTLLVDYQEILYSDVKSIANGMEPLLSGQCFDSLNNSLINGTQTNPQQPAVGVGCLGGSNGIGFGWDDMSIIKIGYEWGNENGTYRIGYSTTEQPIGSSNTPSGDNDVNFNILAPGVVENHITAGYTGGTGDDEWTVFLMYAPSVTVTGVSNLDPNQTISIKMDQLEIGYEARF